MVNSVEEIDLELHFLVPIYVDVCWLSRRNLSSVSGQKGLRNPDIKVWKIAVNFEKAGITFAFIPY